MNIDEIVANCKASRNKTELKKVLTYVSEIQPKVIVEIGSWKGYFLDTLQQAFHPEFLLGIEKDEKVIDPEIKKRQEFIVADSHNLTTLQLLLRFLNGRKIDFLYIDGDHTYEGVKKDFEMYSPLVRKGGIIGFDDIMLNDPKWVMAGVQVCKFWAELIGVPGRKYLEFYDHEGQGTGDGLYYV